jgi:hypothetical protein
MHKNLVAGSGMEVESRRQVKARTAVGLSVLIALLGAITLASAPQLHEKLHAVGPQHECAATIIASGSYETAVSPPVLATIPNVPISSAFLPPRIERGIAAVPTSILEHAPPAQS